MSARIVDDNEWEKCLQGMHTGFSIGGRYAKKWSDVQNGKVVQRYTAAPVEISIVDRPCIPSAKFFTVHKCDGTVEKRAFVTPDAIAAGLRAIATLNLIKSGHRTGRRPLPPDFLQKYPASPGVQKDAVVRRCAG